MLIYYCAVWTFSCSFECSIAALQLVDIQELVAPYSYKRPFQLVSFVLLLLLVLSLFVCLISNLLFDVEDLPLFPESSSLNQYYAIRLPILD